MATIACPDCGLPRAEAEADRPCPVCAAGVGELPSNPRRAPEVTSPITGLAADASQLAASPERVHQAHRPAIVATVLGLLAGAMIVLSVQAMIPATVEKRPEPEPTRNPVPPDSPVPETTASAPAPTARPIPLAIDLPDPQPMVAIAAPKQGPPAPVAEVGKPGLVIDIDRPGGSIQFSRYLLEPGQKAVLRGRVKHVSFYGVEGLDVDASQLQVLESIIVGGSFKNSTLKLNCPGGKVVISSRITDNSRLEAHTQDGEIIFNYPTSGVDGGSKVEMSGRKLEIRGPIAGKGTHVQVTFANGGLFRGSAIRDAAVVEYRKANRGDPPIRIELPEAQIDASAILRRAD